MFAFFRGAGRVCALFSITLWLALAAQAAGAGTGKALGVDPDASAERQSDLVMLTVGSDLFIGDRVVTGDKGQVQIQFEDDTRLVVGPNSAMVLEDYLLRGNGSAGKLAINALSGTFRFVTGNAEKDRYSITTPTGTLAVRGTKFDFFVELLKTSVLTYEGAVYMCSLNNSCVTLTSECEVGEIEQDLSEVLGVGRQAKDVDREFFRDTFRYSVSQAGLKRPFRITNAVSCSTVTPMILESLSESLSSDTYEEPDKPGKPHGHHHGHKGGHKGGKKGWHGSNGGDSEGGGWPSFSH